MSDHTQPWDAGDKAVLDKAGVVIQELRKCQQAMKGYLSAFPTEHFERLRNLQQVWAPFYVVRTTTVGILLQLCAPSSMVP